MKSRLLPLFVETIVVKEVNINADVFLNKLVQMNNDKISCLLAAWGIVFLFISDDKLFISLYFFKKLKNNYL